MSYGLMHTLVAGGGSVVAAAAPAAPARRRRPGQAQMAALQATAEGRALLSQGRREVGAILQADGLVPLAALRLAKGMSQADLVAASGIPQPQLSRLESGVHDDLRVSTLERLAQALAEPMDTVARALRAARGARARLKGEPHE